MSASEPNRPSGNDRPNTSTWADDDSMDPQLVCDECDSDSTHAQTGAGHTEWVCGSCGAVLNVDAIRRKPDWRSFDAGERADRQRASAVDDAYQNGGLGTGFPSDLTDQNGNYPTYARPSVDIGTGDDERTITAAESGKRRLNRLQKRARENEQRGKEQSLRRGLAEIRRLSAALDLSSAAREQAGRRLRQAQEASLFAGHNVDEVAVGAVFIAAYETSEPRTFTTIARWIDGCPSTVRTEYSHLVSNLNVNPFEPNPLDVVPRFVTQVSDDIEASALGYHPETLLIRRSRELLAGVEDALELENRSWKTLAASAVYAAARIEELDLTQSAIADATNTCTEAIRGSYRRLVSVSEYSLDS